MFNPTEQQWWEGRREPVALNMENLPVPADAPKPKTVKRGPALIIGAIILRIIGLVIGVACIGYGGWILYQLYKGIDVNFIAEGVFLCVAGLVTLGAEMRNRWSMRGCVTAYIVLSNYLGRGIWYCFIGGICFALKYQPPYIQLSWLAGGIVGGGVLNIIYYPIDWKYKRNREIARQNAVPRVAFPEEIVYGLNTQHIKSNVPAVVDATPVSPTPSGAEVAGPAPGDNHVVDMPTEKGKEIEEPVKRFADEPVKHFADEPAPMPVLPEPVGAGAC